jgi:hypothetical protein
MCCGLSTRLVTTSSSVAVSGASQANCDRHTSRPRAISHRQPSTPAAAASRPAMQAYPASRMPGPVSCSEPY